MTTKTTKTESKTPKFYDNYDQAAARMKMSTDELKQLKREGCDGFRHSRIYHEEVIRWTKRRELLKSTGITMTWVRDGLLIASGAYREREGADVKRMEKIVEKLAPLVNEFEALVIDDNDVAWIKQQMKRRKTATDE